MAVNLLRETALPIGEIASRVGYSSQSAFAAAVLREFGASPGAIAARGWRQIDASLRDRHCDACAQCSGRCVSRLQSVELAGCN